SDHESQNLAGIYHLSRCLVEGSQAPYPRVAQEPEKGLELSRRESRFPRDVRLIGAGQIPELDLALVPDAKIKMFPREARHAEAMDVGFENHFLIVSARRLARHEQRGTKDQTQNRPPGSLSLGHGLQYA